MILRKKNNNIRSYFLLFVLAKSFFFSSITDVLAEVCNIKGNEFSKIALSKGFINSKAISGGGSCIFFTPKYPEKIIAVASVNKDLVCKVKYFGSKKLSNSWKMMGATITGHSFEFKENTPKIGTNDPKILFDFTIEKGSEKILTMQNVKLSGPKCSKWQESLQ